MDGPDAHLVQSGEKVFGHIDRLFEAIKPIVGGTHSYNSGGDREIEKKRLEKACNDEDTASLETF